MKKLISVILCMAMLAGVLAFAGCKKKSNDETTVPPNTDAAIDNIFGNDTDPVTDDSTQSEKPVQPTKSMSKKPVATTQKTEQAVKPTLAKPTKHRYTIVVEKKNSKGMAEVIIVDGTTYDLKNSNDVAALKKRAENENEYDLLGQLYDVDPTIVVQLGLSALENSTEPTTNPTPEHTTRPAETTTQPTETTTKPASENTTKSVEFTTTTDRLNNN